MSEEQAKPPEEQALVAKPDSKDQKSTGKKKFAHGKVDPKVVGAATAIKKGEVRNPGGRPKKPLIATAIQKIGTKRVPKALVKVLIEKGGFPGLEYGVTYAELGIVGQFLEVAKGKTPNLEVMAEIVGELGEKKPPQSQGQAVEWKREQLEDGSAREQLTIVTERFRERIAKRQQLALDAPAIDAH